MKTLLIAASFLMTACGNIPVEGDEAQVASETSDSEESVSLEGYISPAFDVVVDGKNYSDSEDFYSEKLDALEAELANSEYADWTMSFDADIGLEDLASGMRVYLAATGNKGYAADSYLDYNGRFSFEIPASSQKFQYNLRANKRIGITLTAPVDQETGEQAPSVKWCYNFSAELRNFNADGDSIILNSFTSKLTKYKCQASEEQGGIHLP